VRREVPERDRPRSRKAVGEWRVESDLTPDDRDGEQQSGDRLGDRPELEDGVERDLPARGELYLAVASAGDDQPGRRLGRVTGSEGGELAQRQFCAPPMPRRASVTCGGRSMICEKRTTVTMSSIDTGLP
jgi:hypothetical protein